MSISCLYHVYVLSISCLIDNHVYIMFKVYNNVLPAGSILAHCRTEKMLHEREYSLFRRVYIRSISEAGSILSQKFCHCVASCKYVGSLQSQTAGRARTCRTRKQRRPEDQEQRNHPGTVWIWEEAIFCSFYNDTSLLRIRISETTMIWSEIQNFGVSVPDVVEC